jgi:excisionase family DNA binding protein
VEQKEMMTVKELSNYICVSETTVRKLIRESQIPFIRILSKILFKKEDIDIWLNKMNNYINGKEANNGK